MADPLTESAKTTDSLNSSNHSSANSWAWNVAAFLFLVSGVALSAIFALIPPSQLSPTSQGIGQQISEAFHTAIGLSVHVLVAAWLSLATLLLMRQRAWHYSLRFVGWTTLIPVTAILCERFSTKLLEWIPNHIPVTGVGGACGAWLSILLSDSFTPMQQTWILAGATCFGVALALDFVVIRLLKVAYLILKWSLRQTGIALVEWWKGEEQTAVRPRKKQVPVEMITEEEELDEEDLVAEDLEDDPEEMEPSEEIADIQKADPFKGDGPLPRNIIPIRHHEVVTTELKARRKKWSIPPLLTRATKPESEIYRDYELPTLELLEDPEPVELSVQDDQLQQRARLVEQTYEDFGLQVRVVGINTGPVITQFEIAPEKGVRVSRITRLADDIALNLSAPSVRIVAPIPGKNTIGIETPNEERALVRIKEVMLAAGKKIEKQKLPLFLGKDTEGRPLIQDLADMPHLLIAGRTGTGKSVCMNSIILSLLMTRRPDEVKMIMIDPKMLEMSEYETIPHLMHPVVKDMKKAEAILAWAVDKMEERYELLSRSRVRSIAQYNQMPYEKILERVQPEEDELEQIPERMPYIVIFVDEMADLIMTMKKEVEGHIIRLAQKSRAAGIHLVVATQKPTVDVITGLIKSNLPARVCFKVVNKSDSRVVLDEMGADKLLGKGDMLVMPPNGGDLIRAQGTYASDEEIASVVESLADVNPCFAEELLHLTSRPRGNESLIETIRSRDDLYESAIEIVVREQRGSVSLLQRTLGIGYGRAARMIDFMEEDGIVGGYNGSSAREVLCTQDGWEDMKRVESRSPVRARDESLLA